MTLIPSLVFRINELHLDVGLYMYIQRYADDTTFKAELACLSVLPLVADIFLLVKPQS